EQLRRAEDLTPIEGCNPKSLEPLVGDVLQALVALAGRDHPKQVLDLDAARIAGSADGLEVATHALPERVVLLQLEVGLPEVERADVADRHERVRAGGLR